MSPNPVPLEVTLKPEKLLASNVALSTVAVGKSYVKLNT